MKEAFPNILSGLRIVAVPLLLYFAWNGHKQLFLALLIASLLSDAIDGYLSRRLNVASELGTKLDSWGDMATYLTVPICAWWLWPELLKKESLFVFIAVVSYLVPILAGLARFKRIPSYHTWGAKAAAVIMSVAVLILFTVEFPWPFRGAAVFLALVAFEEVLITLHLPEPRGNVKSIWHVRQSLKENRQRQSG